jgi:hypothetical protein
MPEMGICNDLEQVKFHLMPRSMALGMENMCSVGNLLIEQ